MKGPFNAVDLFSGCGGLSLGLTAAGFNIIYANEINKAAADTYRYNLIERMGHGTLLDVRDISKVPTDDIVSAAGGRKIHLVAGGPPCQGFSMAGRRDINDPRNRLFKELLRVVGEVDPPLFLMENVKGILSMEGGNVIRTIMEAFTDLGYDVKKEVLKASEFGVPQDRERVFIIGTKIGNGTLHPNPDSTDPVTVSEAIGDLSFLDSGESSTEYRMSTFSDYQEQMRGTNSVLHNHEAATHSDKIRKRFSMLSPGEKGQELPAEFRTKKMVLKRLDGSKPAPTVTTLPDDYIHYQKDRILTVREMARLQSFPDDFVFLGPRTTGGRRRRHEIPQYSQVGNAVPPLLARKVGEHLIKRLEAKVGGVPTR